MAAAKQSFELATNILHRLNALGDAIEAAVGGMELLSRENDWERLDKLGAAAANMQHQLLGEGSDLRKIKEVLESTSGLYSLWALALCHKNDARGALKVCMEGQGKSKAELRKLGQELVGRVTQQSAYHRIVTELKQRNMAIVDEQVTADQTVKIRVRNW